MSRINAIQNAILELDGGTFQKLIDAYLFKKLNFSNINPLGSQTGTNKVTKGTPDSFVKNENGKYTLIMYGAVESIPFQKIKQDILSCFEKDKLEIEEEKIEKIISVYTSTNLHIEQLEELKNLVSGVEIELIGLGTISHDLLINYPVLAKEYLDIAIDTEQILSITDFVNRYDKNGMNAPLDIEFMHRESELTNLCHSIENYGVTILTGNSGVGKSRLAIEACQKYEQEGYKVWCIKNNGQALFDDVRFYISEHRKYLLFIDDANQTSNLEYILEYVTNASEKLTVKILMTVRDYAKKRVEMITGNYFQINEITVEPFTADEIKSILKNKLKILNGDYLNRITKIAKGNARLAILAGQFAIQKGFYGIKNATDVFKNYYGEVLDSQNLQKREVCVLFTVSLLGTVRVDDSNELETKILEYFGLDRLSFLNACHKLNEMELLDLYHDQVVRISDQSFGNYILEYVLLDKKYISIQILLDYGFPKFQNKLVYALNTISNLFPSANNLKYIEEQINESWEQADLELQNAYLQTFHNLNQEKSLKLIKYEIENMEIVYEDLKDFDFENAKNKQRNRNEYIDMLGDFKNSDYIEEVVELLFTAFIKRSDLASDFYYVFTEKLSFDSDSHEDDYETEYLIINTLWRLSEEGNLSENFNVFFVHILKQMLNCQVQKVAPSDSIRSISFVTFLILNTDGSRLLRKLIWKILSTLYQFDFLKEKIHEIMTEYHGGGLDYEKYLPIFEFDLECIKEYFIDHWNNLFFDQFFVMRELVNTAKRLNAKYDEIYLQYEKNAEFMIYNTLSQENYGKDWKSKEQKNLAAVIRMVSNYSPKEFSSLFKLCRKIETKKINEQKKWTVGRNLSHIFYTFRNRHDFIKLTELYLYERAPFASNVQYCILNRLVKTLGITKAIQLIEKYDFTDKKQWISNIWTFVDEPEINEDVKERMLIFFTSQKKDEELVVPELLELKSYFIDDPYQIKRICDWILVEGKSNPKVITRFLGGVFYNEDAVEMIKLFQNNIELLEQLYLLNSDSNFDYLGNLLEKLIYRDINFWDKYTSRLSTLTYNDHNTEIFKKVWYFDNYLEYVAIAYKNLIIENFGYISENVMGSLFLKDKTSDLTIEERKNIWVKKYIGKNYGDIEKMKILFGVVQASFSNKVECYLEFLKYSKDSEQFRSLPLTPLTYAWSGSEVPLIDRRINFIEELILQIKGIDYIEHKYYLKEYKKGLEKYRKEVQVREYSEEYDRL